MRFRKLRIAWSAVCGLVYLWFLGLHAYSPFFKVRATQSYWPIAIMAVVFAVAPWIQWTWQFRLQTLLVVMALMAIVLGLLSNSN
jgi:hypothetical protein